MKSVILDDSNDSVLSVTEGMKMPFNVILRVKGLLYDEVFRIYDVETDKMEIYVKEHLKREQDKISPEQIVPIDTRTSEFF